MNIHEAMKARTEDKPFLSRDSWRNTNRITGEKTTLLIDPTNTPDCCIIFSRFSREPTRGWQPNAEDLSADDWYVSEPWY